MPRQQPRIGERFDLTLLHTTGTFNFQFSTEAQMKTWTMHPTGMFQNIFRTSPHRERTMLELRAAGIWFADIATICGFPSASSASAAYIRHCRSIGVEPQVRSENRRGRSIASQIREASSSHSPEFLNREHFGGTTDFGFGVEIEQVGLNRQTLVNITSDLGLPTNMDLHYTHGQPELWKAVPDGSLRGRTTGELVSRILYGTDGLAELRNVMLVMKQQGSKINSSCGQHIHIGINRFNLRTQAMVIRNHAIFQHVFDMLVTPLRRNHRDYARHTEWEYSMANVEAFASGNQHRAHMAKYRSLNLNKYSEYGTFEFRAFQGSLNPRHSVAWLQLHFDFFTFCETLARITTTALNGNLNLSDQASWFSRMPLTMKYIAGIQQDAPMSDSPWHVELGLGNGTRQTQAWDERSPEFREANPLVVSARYQQTVACDEESLNNLAKWALPILQEWVSESSFVGNPTVRAVLKELAVKQFPMLNPDTLAFTSPVTPPNLIAVEF